MKQMAKRYGTVIALGTAIASQGAMAEVGEIKWSGFFNGGYAVSDSETLYNELIDEDGTFDTSSLGLNFATTFGNQWRLAGQLFSHHGDNIIFDWGYATFDATDTAALKFGKLKYPTSLVSEFFDVGYAYPWVTPPAEFYSELPTGANTAFEAYQGVAAFLHTRPGDVEYALEPFAGNVGIDDGTMKKMMGIKASATGDAFQVYTGFTGGELDIDAGEPRDFMTGEDIQIWSIGGSYDANNIVAYAEYGQSEIDNNPLEDSTAGYLSLGYRFGKVLPYATYGMFEQDSGSEQDSMALGVRYDFMTSAAVKAEWKTIDPTARNTAIGGETPAGLFEEMPTDDDVNVFSAVLNLVF